MSASPTPQPGLEQLTERIVFSFLRLFRTQMGADADQATSCLIPGSPAKETGSVIYELQLKTAAGAYTRRMSIARLGEGIHSKSQCFRVIYDDRLVVKIPPTPITDFNAYLNFIAIEKQTAQNLAPDITCIVPSLGVIVDKLPGINLDSVLNTGRREALLSHRLQRDVELQRFLRVGPSFAFFSALADYRFLNEIIADMHDADRELPGEIKDSLGALWHHGAMDSLYDPETAAAIFEVDRLFRKFEKALYPLVKSLKLAHPLDAHWRQSTFIRLILGAPPTTEAAPSQPELMEGVEQIWEPLQAAAAETLAAYTRHLKRRIAENKYQRCRTFMASLSHQVLILLHRLQLKQVAIRDLKPDNIFTLKISSLPEGVYTTPAVNALGLIDLETAVCLSPQKGIALRQPLLSGSPAYATPANLFENTILGSLFTDLPRILQLQDWYAAIGVIFKIIVGEVLFWRTGRILPQILKIRNRAPSTGKDAGTAFRRASTIFWHSVINEFQTQIKTHRESLNLVTLPLPREVQETIDEALKAEIDKPQSPSPSAQETDQKRRTHYQHLHAEFTTVQWDISAHLLLRGMLAMVYSRMHPRHWKSEHPPAIWRT
ncbi:MAG: hypothetical protein WBG37_16420 [Desulfobacterales bacterium]